MPVVIIEELERRNQGNASDVSHESADWLHACIYSSSSRPQKENCGVKVCWFIRPKRIGENISVDKHCYEFWKIGSQLRKISDLAGGKDTFAWASAKGTPIAMFRSWRYTYTWTVVIENRRETKRIGLKWVYESRWTPGLPAAMKYQLLCFPFSLPPPSLPLPP